jgi:ankyrin repeat protein
LASQNGHLEVVKFLIEKGTNVNASREFSIETSGSIMSAQLISEEDGYTSLYLASQNGHLEVVKFLVEKGANINASREFSSENSDSTMGAYLNFREGRIHQPLLGLSKWSP